MAKLSGFFMSTLLIVLCLWINVCHYPDAPRMSAPVDKDATPAELVPQSVSPASEPVEEETNQEETSRPSGLLAEVVPAPVPELLDVSASQPIDEGLDANKATPAVLAPASFPGDGAELDDAPRQKRDVAPRPPVLSEEISNAAEKNAPARPIASAPSPVSTSAPSNASQAAPQSASRSVATPTQDARRSATKPRGAKYVRVPDVEIDAYSGGVRVSLASKEETRVVGATRAGRTLNVAAPAPAAP